MISQTMLVEKGTMCCSRKQAKMDELRCLETITALKYLLTFHKSAKSSCYITSSTIVEMWVVDTLHLR